LEEKDKENIFKVTNTSKTGKINFREFKAAFQDMILICRIKDVFARIKNLNILNQDDL